MFFQLGAGELQQVKRITGCLPPCRYRQFQPVRGDVGTAAGYGVGVMLASTEVSGVNNIKKFVYSLCLRRALLWSVKCVMCNLQVRLEEEQLIYPFLSFLAEFGGALGLFLGFSFMTVWDCVQILIRVMSKNLK